jgi:hyaluronan synthase
MATILETKNQICQQRISSSGRIRVSKKGWIVRTIIISILTFTISYNLYQGVVLNDPFVAYSTVMPIHALLIVTLGWIFYKNPSTGKAGNELVSVVIPVYNQESMIDIVIDSIFNSSYKNIEVIAVNDGSKDSTENILDGLAIKYPNLKVIHKKNMGKRHAVAAGFENSSGKFVVLIDSDSVVDKYAIEEFMKTFNGNSQVGSVVGLAKVWNSKKNLLTKCQDAWYDYSFNIHKATESSLGNVTCCSGCLAGYRREVIEDFLPYWKDSAIQYSDDRSLTTYVIAKSWVRKELAPISANLLHSGAKYDDAEDRILTAQSLVNWKSVYVSSAIVYTEVPEKFRGYLKQQTRWKKGYIRSNFFVSTFFWQKHPLIALVFYLEFMTAFTAPFISLIVLFYEPFILKNFLLPLFFIGGSLITGLSHGIDYKMRDGKSKAWKFKPLMDLFTSHILSWLIIPALVTLKKNQWYTR